MDTEFTPNLSVSENDIAEELSVDCLKEILRHEDIKTHFTTNDKIANIDGYIELLKERRICGKITVQIKTYPQKYTGQAKFDFPTSLLAYAQKCSSELVFLIAVDNVQKTAYWKYISTTIINDNLSKANQQTITIGFETSEILSKENLEETIAHWKSLYQTQSNLIINSVKINQENEELKSKLSKYQNPEFSIDNDYVVSLQKFINTYNTLLDNEFRSIKNHYYFNTWKIGIALFECESNAVSYILYDIKNGKNDLIIKEIPIDEVRNFSVYTEMYRNCMENVIHNSPESYAISLIKHKTIEFIKGKSVLFQTPEIATEYIFDFIKREGNYIKLQQEEQYILPNIKEKLEVKFPNIINNNTFHYTTGHHRINMNVVYGCICYLINSGITLLERNYPDKGNYANTGFVSDCYTSELAFEKLKYFYTRIPTLFDSYMEAMFPLLKSQINFFDGYDLVLVNLTYIDSESVEYYQNHNIVLHYLKTQSRSSLKPEIILSLNYNAELYKQNEINRKELMTEHIRFDKGIYYKGNEYKIFKQEGLDMSLFFGDYYIHNMLYHYLHERFKGYFAQ
jgi:hypothetical protein